MLLFDLNKQIRKQSFRIKLTMILIAYPFVLSRITIAAKHYIVMHYFLNGACLPELKYAE